MLVGVRCFASYWLGCVLVSFTCCVLFVLLLGLRNRGASCRGDGWRLLFALAITPGQGYRLLGGDGACTVPACVRFQALAKSIDGALDRKQDFATMSGAKVLWTAIHLVWYKHLPTNTIRTCSQYPIQYRSHTALTLFFRCKWPPWCTCHKQYNVHIASQTKKTPRENETRVEITFSGTCRCFNPI